MAEHTRPGSADDVPVPTDGSVRTQWVLVLGVSLISAGLGAYEISPASVTPLVRDSMGIDAAAAGLVVGVMFGTAMVASLPVGAALDRTDSRTAVAVAVLGLVVAGGWGWIAAERAAYLSVLGSRVLGGVAYVVVWNAGIDIVIEAVRPDRRATAVGVFTASGPVGFALGQGGGPVVAARFGWPAIFLAFTALSFVGLALFWPTSRGLGRVGGDEPPGRRELGEVLRNRDVWLVGSLGFLGYALYLFINSWAPSYFTEAVGLSLGVSGLLVALFPAVGAVSRISGGLLSDRLFDGRRRPVVLGSFLVTTPLVVGLGLGRSVGVLAAALLGAGFAIQLTLGLVYTYIRELVSGRVAATAVAFQTSVGLAGAFAAPIVGGAVIETAGYRPAFLLAGLVGLVGIAVAWRAPPTR